MKKTAILLLLLISIITSGFSQAPVLINYQAVARNSDGSLITNTNIGIRISILEGSAQGTLLYSEDHQIVTDDFGLFSLKIGGGTSSNDFGSINWGSGQRLWVQVNMDPSNQGNFILMGASELVSVPYSLYASKAGTASPLVRSLTDTERDALSAPLEGSLIFNTTTGSMNIFQGGSWWEVALNRISGAWSCGDPIVDSRDNQTYKTVSIGGKCWMAENLNVGQAIDITSLQSNNEIIEKYCYDNNPENCTTYGALYQWDEVMMYSNIKGSQGICPEGWHVPTDEDWQAMEVSLGMSESDAALSNIWRGTDQGTRLGPGGSAGYNTLYCGRSVPGFGFTALGSYEYVWTSNESGGNAWRRCLSTVDPKIGRYNTFPKLYGMSVRCIK